MVSCLNLTYKLSKSETWKYHPSDTHTHTHTHTYTHTHHHHHNHPYCSTSRNLHYLLLPKRDTQNVSHICWKREAVCCRLTIVAGIASSLPFRVTMSTMSMLCTVKLNFSYFSGYTREHSCTVVLRSGPISSWLDSASTLLISYGAFVYNVSKIVDTLVS